jgi:hypothetical protein
MIFGGTGAAHRQLAAAEGVVHICIYTHIPNYTYTYVYVKISILFCLLDIIVPTSVKGYRFWHLLQFIHFWSYIS